MGFVSPWVSFRSRLRRGLDFLDPGIALFPKSILWVQLYLMLVGPVEGVLHIRSKVMTVDLLLIGEGEQWAGRRVVQNCFGMMVVLGLSRYQLSFPWLL
jgi:hypothetical protein